MNKKKVIKENVVVTITELYNIGRNTLCRVSFYCSDQKRIIEFIQIIKDFKNG